jgi:hypothetical protein
MTIERCYLTYNDPLPTYETVNNFSFLSDVNIVLNEIKRLSK